MRKAIPVYEQIPLHKTLPVQEERPMQKARLLQVTNVETSETEEQQILP